MITPIDADILKHSIINIISKSDPDKAVSPEIRELMAKSLVSDVINKAVKFCSGQKEHGGDIRDRQLQEEILMEQIDLFWYTQAQFYWPASANKKG